jgi:REP element-mobilizing transposase RayT
MPRQPRQDVPGIHHVFARGVDRARIFRDDVDRENYLLMLGTVVHRMKWKCLAYCLMDNHVHLAVEIGEPNLALGMHRLHGFYALDFNTRHARTGHLFERRYGSVVMSSDEQLWWLLGYVALNPVKAGLCEDPSEWRWSSHGAMCRREAPGWLDVARVFEIVGRAGGDPRRRYSELIGG